MILDLLQVTQPINAMNDVTFTLGNLITIGGGFLVTVISFIKLQYDQKSDAKATVVRFETLEKENTKEVEDLNNKILHVQNGKRAIKKDLIGMIEKEADVTKNRIDKTQERMEKDKAENQAEFKEINAKLNKIVGLLETRQ